MKLITSILLTALLSFAIGLYTTLPWFSFVFCSLIVAIAIHPKPWKSFLSGFVAVFVLWVLLAILSDTPNEHLLSTKVANILPLGGNYVVLIFITGLIGGLISGMAALTGSFVRK